MGAYPQVADFNGDKKPDLLLVQSQKGQQTVSGVDVANDTLLFGPLKVAGGGWGGPAVIADLDGDGAPDFGLAGPDRYYAYALKCLVNPKPADCKGADPGVLWTREIRDTETGGNGSVAFDFNGDGRAEIVYRDKCWLRALDGGDGRTRFAKPVSSGTCLETPVIADLDGDGRAELVVSADTIQGAAYCDGSPEGQTGEMFSGMTQGVIVLRDPDNRWAAARPIWNQHTYHLTNIADDGVVPAQEVASWTVKPFGYRQSLGSATMPRPLADLTAAEVVPACRGRQLRASICNRGAAVAEAGAPAMFFESDPRAMGKAICAVKTSQALKPGDCEAVMCDAPSALTVNEVWFEVKSGASECEHANDRVVLRSIRCEP